MAKDKSKAVVEGAAAAIAAALTPAAEPAHQVAAPESTAPVLGAAPAPMTDVPDPSPDRAIDVGDGGALKMAHTPKPMRPMRFKVHPHGGLQHDGCFFGPNEEVPLTEAEALATGLVGRVLLPIE